MRTREPIIIPSSPPTTVVEESPKNWKKPPREINKKKKIKINLLFLVDSERDLRVTSPTLREERGTVSLSEDTISPKATPPSTSFQSGKYFL